MGRGDDRDFCHGVYSPGNQDKRNFYETRSRPCSLTFSPAESSLCRIGSTSTLPGCTVSMCQQVWPAECSLTWKAEAYSSTPTVMETMIPSDTGWRMSWGI